MTGCKVQSHVIYHISKKHKKAYRQFKTKPIGRNEKQDKIKMFYNSTISGFVSTEPRHMYIKKNHQKAYRQSRLVKVKDKKMRIIDEDIDQDIDYQVGLFINLSLFYFT